MKNTCRFYKLKSWLYFELAPENYRRYSIWHWLALQLAYADEYVIEDLEKKHHFPKKSF